MSKLKYLLSYFKRRKEIKLKKEKELQDKFWQSQISFEE